MGFSFLVLDAAQKKYHFEISVVKKSKFNNQRWPYSRERVEEIFNKGYEKIILLLPEAVSFKLNEDQ